MDTLLSFTHAKFWNQCYVLHLATSQSRLLMAMAAILASQVYMYVVGTPEGREKSS